jgi:protein phosphatase
MKLRLSARTDVGKTRDHNEDSYGVGEGEQVEQMGELLVVCDGMGGHAAGEVASQLAVEAILASYYEEASEDRPHALEQAFEQANAQVYARGRGSMGTTGVAALLHHDALHIANVGDSRAYLIRNGEIRQISRDHSFVGDQVAAGLITPDQARVSPHRNVITRALGYQPEVTVDLFRMPLQIGDIIVLSSDGMHGLVTDAEIAEIASARPLDEAAQQLIELANSRGGTDNITVVAAKVEALDWYGADEPGAGAEGSEGAAGDIHERVTVELPTSEVEVAEAPAPAAAVAPPAPRAAEAPAGPAPRAAPTLSPVERRAAEPPAERRLSWLGGLLALLLFVALAGIIAFALYPAPAIAPTSAPAASAVATPLATAAPTAAATAQPTGAPTVQATTVPTAAATAQPTGAPARATTIP